MKYYYFLYPYVSRQKGEDIWLVIYKITKETKNDYRREAIIFFGDSIKKSTKILTQHFLDMLLREVREAHHKGDIVAHMFDRSIQGT